MPNCRLRRAVVDDELLAQVSVSSVAIARASTSVGPPGGNATTTVTKRLGQLCADAADGASASAVASMSACAPLGDTLHRILPCAPRLAVVARLLG